MLRALQSVAAGGGQGANTCDRYATDVGSRRCTWIHRRVAPAGPARSCEAACAPPMRRGKASYSVRLCGPAGGSGQGHAATWEHCAHLLSPLLYILCDVVADREHQATNADVAWPEPLRPRPHAPTPVWLVTTDDKCPRAIEQAQLRTEWVMVQVGEGQPRPRGLVRGTTLLVATEVPHDPHMAVHTLEDQREDAGHLVLHQRGGPAWLREHIMALPFWASTIARAEN